MGKEMVKKDRDVKYEGLRVIGLLAIILAHVNSPAILFQIRNFDVPLMVLVSGAVYGLSSGKNKKYFSYIGPRIGRLLVPTWVFLSIFFLYRFIICQSFSKDVIISSYELLTGIGYIWIIRVFILVAIISPLFVYVYKKVNTNVYLFIILIIYLFYESLRYIYSVTLFLRTDSVANFIFQNILFYILPFGCIAGIGLYLLKATKRSIFYLFLIFLGIFIYFALNPLHQFIQTQSDKYPPGLYYLSYSLAVSLLLYLSSTTGLFRKIFSNKLMLFISFSSLWIYLWQIFFLFEWNSFNKYMPKELSNFISEYLILIVLSMSITYIQKYFITKITEATHNSFLKSVLGISFLR